ncbi:hypothetical protein R3P38DRAFT_2849323 [Favolaschia claudopus]|uniref:Uncharacterized protein n=1 Tax=Favolaschia claudopus TaxID=2862362 RepID=A0AAW0DW18_9AGAR
MQTTGPPFARLSPSLTRLRRVEEQVVAQILSREFKKRAYVLWQLPRGLEACLKDWSARTLFRQGSLVFRDFFSNVRTSMSFSCTDNDWEVILMVLSSSSIWTELMEVLGHDNKCIGCPRCPVHHSTPSFSSPRTCFLVYLGALFKCHGHPRGGLRQINMWFYHHIGPLADLALLTMRPSLAQAVLPVSLNLPTGAPSGENAKRPPGEAPSRPPAKKVRHERRALNDATNTMASSSSAKVSQAVSLSPGSCKTRRMKRSKTIRANKRKRAAHRGRSSRREVMLDCEDADEDETNVDVSFPNGCGSNTMPFKFSFLLN